MQAETTANTGTIHRINPVKIIIGVVKIANAGKIQPTSIMEIMTGIVLIMMSITCQELAMNLMISKSMDITLIKVFKYLRILDVFASLFSIGFEIVFMTICFGLGTGFDVGFVVFVIDLPRGLGGPKILGNSRVCSDRAGAGCGVDNGSGLVAFNDAKYSTSSFVSSGVLPLSRLAISSSICLILSSSIEILETSTP